MDKEKKRFTIGKKMNVFVITTVLLAAVGACTLSYLINANQIDRYYKNLTINSAKNFSALVDVVFLKDLKRLAESEEYQKLRDEAEQKADESIIEDYLKEKHLWSKYVEQRELLHNYLGNMDDIKYIYIVVWRGANEDHDMYLLDDYDTPLYETGYLEEREKEFASVSDTETEIGPIINNGDWGWLCSGFAPVYDDAGKIVCHVGCDVGMEEVMKERRTNLIYMIIGAIFFMIVISGIAFIFINLWVVKPLNKLTSEMQKFSPGENKTYEEAGVIDINLKDRDEIDDIYREIRLMQINIIDYINNILIIRKDKEKAYTAIRNKDEVIGKISEAVYKDSLTGVGNKAGYNRKLQELNTELEGGLVDFAFIMVDVNRLKMINDNYGHSAGDKYLIGCSRVICNIFKHSPVFRIGGDEFVVVLTGEDFYDRDVRYKELKDKFEETYRQTNVDPWLQYSASAGMAEYEPGDEKVEVVFKRADKNMYDEKQRFKQRNNIPEGERS